MNNARNLSRKLWFSLAFFAVFVAGLISVAMATGWGDSIAAIRDLTLAQVMILLALSLINYGLRCLRWHIYTGALNVPTTVSQNFRHYLGGFALTATPGRVGEFIRLRWIWRDTGCRPERTGALVLVDRAADLSAVGVMLAVSIGLSAKGLQGGWAVAALAVFIAWLATRSGAIIWGIGLLWRIFGILPRAFATLRSAARQLSAFSHARIFFPATLLGIIGWGAEAYAFFLLLGWMGAEIGLALAFAIFFFSMLTGGATGLPGGIGGAEAAMIGVLALNGVPLEIAIAATAVIRITTLWFAIAVGFCVFPFAEQYSSKKAVKLSYAME